MGESTSGTRHPHKRGHKNGNGSNGVQHSAQHGRVPPQNLEAEKSLLGCLFDQPELLTRELVDACSAGDFFAQKHRLIYAAMLALQEDGVSVDRASIVEQLESDGKLEAAGGAGYLVELQTFAPSNPLAMQWAKTIHQHAQARRLIETATQIAEMAYTSGAGDVAALQQQARERIRIVTEDAPRGNRFLQAHTRFTVEELLSDPPPLPFLLWPYLQKQTVAVLSGSGGGGKTALLTQLAVSRAIGRQLFPGLVPSEGSTAIITTEDRKVHYRQKLRAAREQLGSEFDQAAQQIAERVHLLDLAGLPVRLIHSERGEQFMPTGEIEELAEALQIKAPDADLLIIETISRVTGGIETNPAMNVLVNACERLSLLTGAVVTLVGHVGQNTARQGLVDAYSARGGSALGDNARSSMVLAQLSDQNVKTYAPGLELSPEEMKQTLVWGHTKSNGAPPAQPRLLRKESTKWGLVLVDADLSDAPRKDPAPTKKKKANDMTYDEHKQALVDYVFAKKKPVTLSELFAQVGGRRKGTISDEMKELVKAGQLARTDPNDGSSPVIIGSGTSSGTNQGTDQGSLRFPAPLSPTERERGGREPESSALPVEPGTKELIENGNQGTSQEDPPPHTDEDAPE